MAEYETRPLIGYLPNVLKEVREYQALMHGEQAEVLALFAGIQDALDNQFVLSSTEYGVKRWEKILGIVPKASCTLDERKFTILSRLAERLPYTFRMLGRILDGLCGADGYKMNLRNELYELEVLVQLTAANNFNDVEKMLKRVIPANLTLKLSVEFNQHYKLKSFAHGFLRDYTHEQLRTHSLEMNWNTHKKLKALTHSQLMAETQHDLRNGDMT
jgi:hypothetical protein